MTRRLSLFIFIVVALLCSTQSLVAQTDTLRNDSTARDSSRLGRIGNVKELLDTVRVYYRIIDDARTYEPDSALQDFHLYAQPRRGRFEHIYNGNVGQAHTAIVYEPQIRNGYFAGLEQFDRYRIQRQNLRFFNSRLPFTELYYTQAGQANSTVRAEIGYKLGKNLLYTLNYGQTNQRGAFSDQRSKVVNVGFGLYFKSNNQRYEAYLSYITNSVRAQENGGITADSLLDGSPTSFPEVVPTNLLSTPETSYRFLDLNLVQFYHPFMRDSITPASTRFRHQISYKRNIYKFFDQAPEADYYQQFYINERGLRHYLRERQLYNELSYQQNLGNFLVLEAGAWHRLTWLDQEVGQQSLNDLSLKGKLYTPIQNKQLLNLDAEAQVGIGRNAGDYNLRAKLGLNFGRAGLLEGQILNQRFSPMHLAQNYTLNRAVFWQNNFRKSLETSILVNYSLPLAKLELFFASHTIGAMVYFDTLATPQQASSPYSMVQLGLKHQLKVWRFHLDNQVVWQKGNSDLIRVPELFIRSQFYFESRVFKKRMLLRLGIDMRYLSNYKANSWMPITGQFHLQDQQTLQFYPLLDAFASARVKRFRLFASFENFSQDLFRRGYFNTPNYPMPWRVFRFGVSWYLSD